MKEGKGYSLVKKANRKHPECYKRAMEEHERRQLHKHWSKDTGEFPDPSSPLTKQDSERSVKGKRKKDGQKAQ